MEKYCTKCGTELIEQKTGKFNPYTGEPETMLVCPVRDCRHFYHKLKRKPGLLGILGEKYCTECGMTFSDGV